MYAQSRSCITWTQLKTLVQAWRGHVMLKVAHALPGHN